MEVPGLGVELELQWLAFALVPLDVAAPVVVLNDAGPVFLDGVLTLGGFTPSYTLTGPAGHATATLTDDEARRLAAARDAAELPEPSSSRAISAVRSASRRR